MVNLAIEGVLIAADEPLALVGAAPQVNSQRNDWILLQRWF
jgi:hypothetical protein